MAEPPHDALPPGTRVGPYQVLRALGEGGMGAVYQARHAVLGGFAAIKVLHPEILRRDPAASERFLREGHAAALIRHPNVLQIFDCGTLPSGAPYLVMEFLEGEDLYAYLRREAPLPPQALCEVFLPVIAAVAAVHDRGVIHRDLKPENVFLQKAEGRPIPKVLDFGISKVVGQGQGTRAGLIMGSPQYLAPELVDGAIHATPASDQYALGAMLYEGLTGQVPFPWPEGMPAQVYLLRMLQAPLVPPRKLRPDLPAALDQVICRALARKPAGRFSSLRALGQALLPFAGPRGRLLFADAFVEEPGDIQPRWRDRRALILAGAAGLLLLLGAGLLFTRARAGGPDAPARPALTVVPAPAAPRAGAVADPPPPHPVAAATPVPAAPAAATAPTERRHRGARPKPPRPAAAHGPPRVESPPPVVRRDKTNTPNL